MQAQCMKRKAHNIANCKEDKFLRSIYGRKVLKAMGLFPNGNSIQITVKHKNLPCAGLCELKRLK
jgi:hypothetical protein